MTLLELSREYLKEEEKLTKQINAFLPVAKTLSGEQRHEAYRRLACLYEMRHPLSQKCHLEYMEYLCLF